MSDDEKKLWTPPAEEPEPEGPRKPEPGEDPIHHAVYEAATAQDVPDFDDLAKLLGVKPGCLLAEVEAYANDAHRQVVEAQTGEEQMNVFKGLVTAGIETGWRLHRQQTQAIPPAQNGNLL